MLISVAKKFFPWRFSFPVFWYTKSIKFHFRWGTKPRDQKQGTGNDCDVNSGLQGAYHLARKSGNFGLKSIGKVIFRKFRSEIVEYLQRYYSFSVRNGTAEISLPLAKLSSFQSLINRKQLLEIEVQMVSAISFSWFADFGKTLTIIQRSSQPVYSDKW